MALHIRKTLLLTGMTCPQCEKAIRNALQSLEGMMEVQVSLRNNSATVWYDSLILEEHRIHQAITDAGYDLRTSKDTPTDTTPTETIPPHSDQQRKFLQTAPKLAMTGILVILAVLLAGRIPIFGFLPEINSTMGYGMLFVAGLMTSFHCIGMCGGINLAQCLPGKSNAVPAWKPSLFYNLGRVLSYTLIGGVVGALGSVLTLSGSARGLFAIIAGLLTVLMGISLLGIFPGINRFIPRLPPALRQKLLGRNENRGPFWVGMLNGLMPCGPLQAMQLYALGTGSALTGAASMLFFSLGTLPAMFALGAVGTLLGKKFTRGLTRVGAMLVVVMGIVLVQRGLSLGGLLSPSAFAQENRTASTTMQTSGQSDPLSNETPGTATEASGSEASQLQEVTGEVTRNAYPVITVRKGIPVRLNLHAEPGSLNGCNKTVVFPEFGIEQTLQNGDNLIEFIPETTGTIGYTCWMGMVSGAIEVVD